MPTEDLKERLSALGQKIRAEEEHLKFKDHYHDSHTLPLQPARRPSSD